MVVIKTTKCALLLLVAGVLFIATPLNAQNLVDPSDAFQRFCNDLWPYQEGILNKDLVEANNKVQQAWENLKSCCEHNCPIYSPDPDDHLRCKSAWQQNVPTCGCETEREAYTKAVAEREKLRQLILQLDAFCKSIQTPPVPVEPANPFPDIEERETWRRFSGDSDNTDSAKAN